MCSIYAAKRKLRERKRLESSVNIVNGQVQNSRGKKKLVGTVGQTPVVDVNAERRVPKEKAVAYAGVCMYHNTYSFSGKNSNAQVALKRVTSLASSFRLVILFCLGCAEFQFYLHTPVQS